VREFRKFQETMKRDLSDVFGDDTSPASDPPPMLPPKDPEANGSGTEGPRGEAAESRDEAGEPGTEAPPDAARSD
jgi:hypothetical protein